MKAWIYTFILAVSSLGVFSQSCPQKHFSAVFVASIDQTVDPTQLHHDDPELIFLKRIMRFQEEEIHYIFEDAIQFFNYSFGLDFSASQPDEQNVRVIENARMSPIIAGKDINHIATANNWIRNGNTHSTCYKVYDGGILVTFSADQTLYGKYGGDNGKPAGVNVVLVYGFYNIDACKQSPVIIHYRCGAPIRAEPVDGTFIANCYAYNRILGHGSVQGIGVFEPDIEEPEKYRVTIRNTITFEP